MDHFVNSGSGMTYVMVMSDAEPIGTYRRHERVREVAGGLNHHNRRVHYHNLPSFWWL